MLQLSRCALMSIAVLLLLGAQGSSQQFTSSLSKRDVPLTTAAPTLPETTSAPRFIQPRLLGTYYADGNFAAPESRRASLYASNGSTQVPPWIARRSTGTVIEDHEAPMRARSPLRPQSAWSNLRDSIVTLAYGKQSVLASPTHVTVDSRNRLIIADPDSSTVHVLDGPKSFRIAGGQGRRLRFPNGIAVDGEDNVYVADAKRGLVLVYNSDGIFQRYIGALHEDESIFQEPTAIAIDARANRLYVLDSPVHELLVLDLEGRLVRRVGGRRDKAVVFEYPSEIAINGDHIVVMDSYGSRIQVFDRDFGRVSEFRFRTIVGAPVQREMALAVDSMSNIYIGGQQGSKLKVYRPSGTLVATLSLTHGGRDPLDVLPAALWIDPTDRIYVADREHHRVQVFQKE